MSEIQIDDTHLLALVNLGVERNRASQDKVKKCLKIIPERISKVNQHRNLYIAQSAFVEHLKHEIKPNDSLALENAYFYKYSKRGNKPIGGIYYQLLEKSTQSQKDQQWSDAESESGLFEENRLNKASNIMTADMIDFGAQPQSTYK